MNHIVNANKKVSDTPISDSTPHNVGELGMLCRKLERELTAAHERIKRLEEELERTKQDRNAIAKTTREPLLLRIDRAAERIKRLEDSVSYWNECYNDLNHKVQNRDNY